jgi:hypothetical protein
MSNHKFSSDLIDFGTKMKKGYAELAECIGKVIALITGIVAVLVTFTDVTFLGLATKEITATVIIMLICSYVIYFSLESTGERLGEGSEEYTAALVRYNTVRELIKPEDTVALRVFCNEYSSDELSYRRSIMLCENGLSEKDLENYLSGRISDRKTRRALRKISRERAHALTPSILLNRGGVSNKSELSSPTGQKIRAFMSELFPSTVCVIFTASIVLSLKGGLCMSSIIEGIVKLSALPIIGAKGFVTGYCYSKSDGARWLETKATLLERYVEARERREKD